MLRKRVARIRIQFPGFFSNIWTAKPDWIPASHFPWLPLHFSIDGFLCLQSCSFIQSSTFEKNNITPQIISSVSTQGLKMYPGIEQTLPFPNAWDRVNWGAGRVCDTFLQSEPRSQWAFTYLHGSQVVLRRRLSAAFPSFMQVPGEDDFISILIIRRAFACTIIFTSFA